MKGQASVELIIVLAIALVVLAVIAFSVNEQMRQLRQNAELLKADTAVSSLADAAEYVNANGVGSKEVFLVEFPDNMDAARSFVKGRLVNIGVYTGSSVSDINAKTSMMLNGSLPSSGGGHRMLVESVRGAVMITEAG